MKCVTCYKNKFYQYNSCPLCSEKTVQDHCSTNDPLTAMAFLRNEKDNFKYPNL